MLINAVVICAQTILLVLILDSHPGLPFRLMQLGLFVLGVLVVSRLLAYAFRCRP